MPSSRGSDSAEVSPSAGAFVELEKSLLMDLSRGVLTLTINRPARSNAIDPQTWRTLRYELRGAADDPEVRAVVITGSGRNFCAGADLGRTSTGAAADHSHLRFMREVGEVIRTLHHLPMPTIACVQGAAVGAGWNLALACDVVVAAEGARFCQVFARRGLAVDSGGSWLLPKLVGLQRAKELILFARELSAAEAHELGLVTRLVGLAELDDTVWKLATELADGAPIALSLSKALVNESYGADLAHALESEARAQTAVLASEDGAEALAAFVEKRTPRFVGR
jgi:enoyl-CoA hydratase/carnithine racemase